jgi:hypothetical protein
MTHAELLQKARELEALLPPAPWEADIDDPGPNEDFTGKFYHPDERDGQDGASTALYTHPELARNIAEMRNLFHLLVGELDRSEVSR